MPGTRQSPAHRLAPLGAAAACLVLLGGLARAQDTETKRTYANITSAKVERFPNAIRITLRGDGTLEAYADSDGLMPYLTVPPSGWRYRDMAPIERVPFLIGNGRSGVGSFVDVASYPVSHIALMPFGEGNLGIGLRCELVFYKPAGTLGLFDDSMWDNWDRDHWRTEHDTHIAYDIRRSNDMRSLVITVLSDIFEDTARKERLEPLPGDAAWLRIGNEGDSWTIEALNAPVTRLLQALGERSSRTLTISQLKRERWVSLSLAGISLERALQAIATVADLACADDGAGGWAFSEARASDAPSYGAATTETVVCQNITPSRAIGLLPRVVLPYVHVDEQRNAVIVSGSPRMIEKVRADIARLDVPPTLVEVQVWAITTATRSQRDRLWSWGMATRDSALLTGVGSVQFGSGSATSDGEGAAMIVVPRPTPVGGWQAAIEALAVDGEVSVLARPSIRVVSGHTGELFVGGTRFVSMEATRQSAGGLNPIPVGVSLRVTPTVAPGSREITAEIDASVASVATGDSTASSVQASRRNFAGTLRIGDGDTILVGGLLTEQSSRMGRGLPLLGEMPGLGELFRARGRAVDLENVSFLLTARLVRDGAPDPAGERSEVILEGEAPDATHLADRGYLAHRAERAVGASGRVGEPEDR